ncbi:hypothetical protein, partial [Staphylococcus aureus]
AADLGLVCPAAQGGEAAWAGDISVLAAPDLLALINHFRGTQLLAVPRRRVEPDAGHVMRAHPDAHEKPTVPPMRGGRLFFWSSDI